MLTEIAEGRTLMQRAATSPGRGVPLKTEGATVVHVVLAFDGPNGSSAAVTWEGFAKGHGVYRVMARRERPGGVLGQARDRATEAGDYHVVCAGFDEVFAVVESVDGAKVTAIGHRIARPDYVPGLTGPVDGSGTVGAIACPACGAEHTVQDETTWQDGNEWEGDPADEYMEGYRCPCGMVRLDGQWYAPLPKGEG